MPNKMSTRVLNYAVPSALTAGSEDPIDFATLFGSLRTNVPAAMAAYHSDLNANEEQELAKRLGPAGFYARSPGQSFGTPLEREPVGGNDLSYAVHMQELRSMNPHLDSMSAAERARAIKNYVDYKKIEAMGKPRFETGGGVKKQAVNLARRGLLGLRAAPRVEHLPALHEAPKPEITAQTLLNEPVTRRSVLQSSVGQLARHALPVGELVPSIAKAAEATAPASAGLHAIPGLMAQLLREGKSVDEAARIVDSMVPETIEGWSNVIGDRIADPYSMTHVGSETPVGTIFSEMLRPAHPGNLLGLRDQMRVLREMSPEDYERLKEAARDYRDYGGE